LRSIRRSSRVASTVRAQGIGVALCGTLSVLAVARRTVSTSPVLQGSALRRGAPVNPVLQGSALRRGAPVNPVLQGSALWRAPEHGFTKNQANGGRHTRILSAKAAPGSCARDWSRPMRHVERVGSGTANRLDESGFAGVCPMASPDPAATKIRVAEHTAILSRSVPGSCARDWSRPMRHVERVGSSTANRLDESGFAGVCPMASL
jgi:hypothetical protein